MKTICVLNPLAADGAAQQRWSSIASLLAAFRIEYELLADQGKPIDAQLIRCLDSHPAGTFGVIAGIGGDGTHSALINALMKYRGRNPDTVLPAYAFIPLGTGNDIAKSFGLESREDFFVNDLRRAVSTIVHGADYWLDLGLLNGVHFADALTIGLDSRILHERNLRRRQIQRIPILRHITKGRVLYTWCMGRIFWRHQPLHATVTVDGSEWYSGPILNLVINNTRIYAGGFDFCSDAYANDGLLDVVVFKGHTDYLKRYLLAIRSNPRQVREFSERLSRMSSRVQGQKISVHLSRAEAAQLDGEEIPSSATFEVSVVPKAIHIKTPAEP